MTVFVVTKSEFMAPEIYVAVKSSMKAAEKVVREQFPNARKDDSLGLTSFLCKDKSGHESLMFIRKEEI